VKILVIDGKERNSQSQFVKVIVLDIFSLIMIFMEASLNLHLSLMLQTMHNLFQINSIQGFRFGHLIFNIVRTFFEERETIR
jgi:hypothetical protein